MEKFLIVISIGLCVVLVAANSYNAATNGDDDGPFNLNPVQSTQKLCKTKDKRDGICVHEGTCTEGYDIAIHGILDETDLRQRDGCSGEDWCCVHPNMSMFMKGPQTPTPPPPPRGCRTGLKDSCPWCVALYRNNPRTNEPLRFCGGAVVGSRFVLTAASCAIAFKRFNLWIQLPGNTKQYPVNTTVNHKQFNSGTRENDVALLLLTEDVEWPEGRQENLGACLGLRTPLAGDCVGISFDDSDQLKFTPLTVTPKSCSDRGSTNDAACGRAITGGSCSVTAGLPVLCPYGSNDLIVAGLVRDRCKEDSTILGSLMASAEWINEELKDLALPANLYTISQ